MNPESSSDLCALSPHVGKLGLLSERNRIEFMDQMGKQGL